MNTNQLGLCIVSLVLCHLATVGHRQGFAQEPEAIHDGYREPVPLALLDDGASNFVGALAALRECQTVYVAVYVLHNGELRESVSLTAALVTHLADELGPEHVAAGDAGRAHVTVFVSAGLGGTATHPVAAIAAVSPGIVGRDTEHLKFSGYATGQTAHDALTELVRQLRKGDFRRKR